MFISWTQEHLQILEKYKGAYDNAGFKDSQNGVVNQIVKDLRKNTGKRGLPKSLRMASSP